MAPPEVVSSPQQVQGNEAQFQTGQGASSFLGLSSVIAFLETYGWYLLAGLVAASFLAPSVRKLLARIDDNLHGEDHRKREARLDKQREQVRKKQAEAFEKRLQEVEEQKRSDPCCGGTSEREKRLEEINERAARLGLQPKSQAQLLRESTSGRQNYNPLMSGDVPRYRPQGRPKPRGGG